MKKIRNASHNDLLYLDMQDITSAYTIQFVLRIKTIIDINKLQEAISFIQNRFPFINVFLKNNKYYHSNKKVTIKNITLNSNDDLYNNSFFREKVDYKKESFLVYLASHRNNKYLVFRFSHAVVDGQGAMLIITDIMNYLNNKKILELNNNITDYEFVKKLNYYKKKESIKPLIKNSYSRSIKEYNFMWREIEIDGYINNVISKLAEVIASEFKDNQVRIMIPNDLRRYEPNINYISNLTLPLFLTVNKNDSYSVINSNLLHSIKQQKSLNLSNAFRWYYKCTPRFIRKSVLKMVLNVLNKKNYFSVGAIISHVGKINLDNFNNPYITFDDFVSVPINQPLGPFALSIIEHSHKTKIMISYYEHQFNEKYIDDLVNKIKKNLQKKDLYSFNNTKISVQDNFISDIFESITNNSDDIAIYEENNNYTYQEFAKRIKQFNTLIKNKSVKGRAILYINRSVNYLSAVISCIINNIVFIPIDKTITKSKLESIIHNYNIEYFITDQNLKLSIKTINIEGIHNLEETKVNYNYNPEQEIYNIFTSGSTSVPKCVPIKMKGVNNYLIWAKEEYKPQRRMVIPLFTSLSVDLTMISTFLPLMVGGSIKTYKDTFNVSILNKILHDDEINVIKLTPTHLSFMLNSNNCVLNKEIIIVGGEKLPLDYCKKMNLLNDKCKIYNSYGPTETTIACTYYLYSAKDKLKTVPIGKPIHNMQVIIYENGKIVTEPNRIGEILIKGIGVFDGYYKQEVDCFKKINDSLYYCTGDLGYIYDNNIYIVGRKDNQVKIHGNRVELDEIANKIKELKEIKDSLVVYQENLYAFVIQDEDITEENIKAYLAKHFPSYMIPYKIYYLKQFPIKENGKIKMDELLKNITISMNKNNTDEDDQLITLIQSIKKIDKIDKEKNLFDIGLESYDIVMFCQLINEKYINNDLSDKFTDYFFDNVNKLSLYDIEKLIIKYGKNSH